MALALARKYRPRDFASVAVQSHVSNTLKGAIARGRVAQGYLLCGPRGVGKTTLARILAMALNCERRTEGEPCGECTSCQRIWSGAASLDVVEIDAASNRGVDDARDLRERAMYAPSGDERYKVYIVDEAHMLTREAWNALLKMLEEPPPRVVFVFATTEPQKIAQTAAPVLSRLQRFDLKRIGSAEIRERLQAVLTAEGTTAEPDALMMIARAADGSMRDALSLTDQVLSLGEGAVTAERVRQALGLVPEDEYLAMLDLIAERRAGDVFGAVGRLVDAGVDLGQFLTGLGDALRALLATVLGGEPGDVSETMRAALAERREAFEAGDLLRMLNALAELEQRFRRSGQQQLLLETLLVRFALLDRTVALESLLRGLESPSGGVGERRAATSERKPGAGRGAGASPTLRSDAEAPAPVTVRADSAPAAARARVEDPGTATAPARAPLDLNLLVERWDDVVGRLRDGGRGALAAAVQHAMPVAVTAGGDVTVELEERSDVLREALEAGRDPIVGAISAEFDGVKRLIVRVPEGAAAPVSKRLTEESVREERMSRLRRRDPLLDAAIDALDLELLD